MARKKSSNGVLKVLGVIAVALAILLILGYIFQMPQSVFEEDDAEDEKCDLDSDPGITIDGFDTENPGSSLSTDGMYRKEGSSTWTDMETGSEMDLEVGETYVFYMGSDTSSEVDFNHGHTFEYTVPCKPSETIEKELAQYEDESGLSATFYNEEGDAEEASIGAGEDATVELEFSAGVDEYFGNPFTEESNPNVLCMNMNKTTIADVEQVKVDGNELSTVSAPRRHDVEADKSTYCYEAPVITDDDTTFEVDLIADDSDAPDDVDDEAKLYAGSWTLNSDTGDVSVGVENNDGDAVATDDPATLTIDFIA